MGGPSERREGVGGGSLRTRWSEVSVGEGGWSFPGVTVKRRTKKHKQTKKTPNKRTNNNGI